MVCDGIHDVHSFQRDNYENKDRSCFYENIYRGKQAQTCLHLLLFQHLGAMSVAFKNEITLPQVVQGTQVLRETLASSGIILYHCTLKKALSI